MKYLFFSVAILVCVAKTLLHAAPYSTQSIVTECQIAFCILCALIAYKADQIRDEIKNK